MIRLILVRHGVTEWNQAGRYQGHHDVPLGATGRAQAVSAAERLRGESITTAFSSDLSRAHETARIILRGRSVSATPTPSLREMSWGAWEGLSGAEAAERFGAEWDAWTRDPVNERPPGAGESFGELAVRVRDFYHSTVEALARDGDGVPSRFLYRTAGEDARRAMHHTALFVSHGGPLRALLAHCLEVPLHLYWRFGIRPASVSILDVYPEGAIAEVIGDTSHLEVPSSESSVAGLDLGEAPNTGPHQFVTPPPSLTLPRKGGGDYFSSSRRQP